MILTHLCSLKFNSLGVTAVHDHAKITNKKRTIVAESLAQVFAHYILVMTFSESSIRRSRKQNEDNALFFVEGPILHHRDKKLLPDIDGAKKTVERVPIIVSRNYIEKLLCMQK